MYGRVQPRRSSNSGSPAAASVPEGLQFGQRHRCTGAERDGALLSYIGRHVLTGGGAIEDVLDEADDTAWGVLPRTALVGVDHDALGRSQAPGEHLLDLVGVERPDLDDGRPERVGGGSAHRAAALESGGQNPGMRQLPQLIA